MVLQSELELGATGKSKLQPPTAPIGKQIHHDLFEQRFQRPASLHQLLKLIAIIRTFGASLLITPDIERIRGRVSRYFV